MQKGIYRAFAARRTLLHKINKNAKNRELKQNIVLQVYWDFVLGNKI